MTCDRGYECEVGNGWGRGRVWKLRSIFNLKFCLNKQSHEIDTIKGILYHSPSV